MKIYVPKEQIPDPLVVKVILDGYFSLIADAKTVSMAK